MQNYIYIFGYGSLISPHGINCRSLQKTYTRDDLSIAHLKGYKREWNAYWEKYHNYRFLGLTPSTDSIINGVIFKLNNEDTIPFFKSEGINHPISMCDRLNLDKNLYIITDVTNNLIWNCNNFIRHPEDRVFTLVTTNPTTNGNIPVYYINHINEYLKEFNEDFVNEFWSTTPKPI